MIDMKKQKKHECLEKKQQSICLFLALLILASCASPSQQPAQTIQTTPTECADKNCFITAANNCQEISTILNEDIGTFKYTSSKDCIFTKTLITLNDNETPEIKKLLTGKSLTCKYEQTKFDQRLATSLFFGTEYCEGELKDILGKLIAFAENK